MMQDAGSRRSSPHIDMRGLRVIRYLPQFARLYWRLLGDSRVSLWPKMLLALTLLYAVSPLDFIPDVVPVIGVVDDLVLLLVACRLFIYMCPRAVVQEHVRRIDGTV